MPLAHILNIFIFSDNCRVFFSPYFNIACSMFRSIHTLVQTEIYEVLDRLYWSFRY